MMILATASVLVSLFYPALCHPSEGVEIQTSQGAIYGTSELARNGRQFYSFRGIPFAKPPLGSRRFKDPEAADNWSEVRNGSWIAPECVQPDQIGGFSLGLPKDEDCLYLNVFTPLKQSSVAVMVYIHGGGFGSGGMTLYQPHVLLTQDVILVTMQYRLGLLGFLSTEDEVAPGNLGLKDQTQALRWVKNNIQAYGGDPHRVTVFGESSGGRAAHLQMLTPASRGLFNRVILQSGTAITPGTTQPGGFRNQAQELGQLFNCTIQKDSGQINSTELIACLQQIPASQFVQPKALKNKIMFGIRVDGDYMPASPEQLMLRGDYHKCDIMAGFTQHEGAGSVMGAILINQTEYILNSVNYFISLMFNILPTEPMNMTKKAAPVNPELDYLVAQALQYYTGQQNISQENYDQVVRLLTSMLSLSHDQTMQLHARDTLYNRQIFAYEFKHRGEKTLMHILVPQYDDSIVTLGKHWVHHGDDLLYLFPLDFINVPLTQPEDIIMSEVMVKLWTNFAILGNPTPDGSLGFTWSPVGLLSQRQQLVLKPEPYMEINDRCKDLEFWQSLPKSESFIITEQKCENNEMCLLQ